MMRYFSNTDDSKQGAVLVSAILGVRGGRQEGQNGGRMANTLPSRYNCLFNFGPHPWRTRVVNWHFPG
eukprot:1424414-Rhodomonas_salina.1